MRKYTTHQLDLFQIVSSVKFCLMTMEHYDIDHPEMRGALENITKNVSEIIKRVESGESIPNDIHEYIQELKEMTFDMELEIAFITPDNQ